MTNTNIKSIFGASLSERVAIYVPSTVNANDDGAALGDAMTAEVAGELSELFGGATISIAAGAWMSEAVGLIREQVQIVYSYCTPEQLLQYAQRVREIAERVKSEMSQEAVSVEINSNLYLI